MAERIKFLPSEIATQYGNIQKDKCTTEASSTILTQASMQFGGENRAVQRFREIIEPFRSKWWPDGLSEYQPGAALTYASLAFDKPSTYMVDTYRVAVKVTGNADVAGDLVAISVARQTDINSTCNLAIDIYKTSNHPPYNGIVSGDAGAVMLASAEIMSSRETASSVLTKINKLKKWDSWNSGEPQAMLVQSVIARGGDLDQNIQDIKSLLDIIDTKEYRQKLKISSEPYVALVALSCFLGEITPEQFYNSQHELVVAGCNPEVATRLAHADAMADKDILSTFSVASEIIAGKVYIEDYTFLYLGKK